MRPANTTIVALVSEIARSMIGFLVTLYLARVLGAEVLGAFFVVIALVVWLKVPLNAIGSALTKRVSEGRATGAFLGAGGVLYAGFTTAVGVIILVARHQVNAHVGEPVAPLVAALLLANGLFSYVTCALEGQKRVAASSLLQAMENIAEGGAQVAFVLLGAALAGLVGGQILALVVGGAVGLAMFRTRPVVPGMEHVRSLGAYARYSWLGTVSGRTFGWMDTLVLSFFVGSGLIGVYEISWRIASVLVLLSNAIKRTIFPEISELSAEGDTDKIRFFLNETLFYGGMTAIPGLFGALVLGPRILRIYGPEFTTGASVLAVLIVARLVDAYGSLLLTAINGLDRPDIAFRINAVFMVSNLVLNIGLIVVFGWIGAAIATTLSACVTVVLGYNAVESLIGEIELPLFGIGVQVLASAVMAGFLLVAVRVAPVTNSFQTVGYVLAGAVVYALVLTTLSERVRSKACSLIP